VILDLLADAITAETVLFTGFAFVFAGSAILGGLLISVGARR
jgi:hypothetical protein